MPRCCYSKLTDWFIMATKLRIISGVVGIAFYTVSPLPVYSQGYGGTGISLQRLEELCRAGALMGATGGSGRNYIDTTLQGRYSMGNSTSQQYRNQINWLRSNCPAYR